MTREELPEKLRGYEKAVDMILSFIAEHGGQITERQFDQHFCLRNGIRFPFSWFGGGSYVIAAHGRQRWLQLLKLMCYHDLVTEEHGGELVIYRTP